TLRQVLPPSVVLNTPRSGFSPHTCPRAATQATLGSFGSSTTRWMCSVFSSPRWVQVRPPPREREMPLRIETLLRGFPSPVPTQTMSGLAWLTAMAPIDATGWSSKMGVQERPPVTDFPTPPAARTAYITSGLESTTSSAGRRPLITAGPIARADRPASRSGAIVSGGPPGAGGGGGGGGGAGG